MACDEDDARTGASLSLADFFSRFRRASLLDKAVLLDEAYWQAKSQLYYKRYFGEIGQRSKIINPMRLSNVQNIFIGDDVMINHHAFLLTRRMESGRPPRLVIDSGAVLGHFNHITCVDSVHIGKKVLVADKVHISDNSHVYADPNIPIIDQSFFSKGAVSIGDGTWIGENASIQSCRIGKHCVVGSNSVVTRDIPDYTVVAGAPARVIRRLDHETGLWNRVTEA